MIRPRAHVIWSLAAMVLVACGGGGSGSSGGGFSLRLDRSSVTFEYFEGVAPPSQTVTATVIGAYSGTIYVGAIINGTGIDPNISLSLSSMQAAATLTPASGLVAGSYSGTVQFLACSDAACSHRIGGTPLTISYSVIVKESIRATPATVTLAAVSGNSASQDVAVSLPPGDVSYLMSSVGANWLQLSNISNTGFHVVAKSMPSGSYSTSLTLQASGGSTTVVYFNYTVTVPPGGEHGLLVNSPNLTISATEGSNSAWALLDLQPPTWDPRLLVTIEYDSNGPQGWLMSTPAVGGFRIDVDASTLTAGTYAAQIYVATVDEPNNHWVVPVAVTVGPGLVRPADVIRTPDSESSLATLSGSVPVDLADGAPVGWTASTDAAWLHLTRSTGTTGTTLDFAIDAAWVTTAKNFTEYTANVTLVPSVATMSPVGFAVRVTPQFAEIGGIGPRDILAGRASQLIVRGRGFQALADPMARLRTGGAPVTALQRISDTQMLLDLGSSITAGRYILSISSALGFVPRARVLNVTAPATSTYSTLPRSGGFASSLIVDAARGSLLAMNAGAGQLLRWRLGASGWTSESVNVAGISNLGLTSDDRLLVTTGDGTLHWFDPESLAETKSVAIPSGLDTSGYVDNHGIAFTSDGGAWLPTGWSVPHGIGYLDPYDDVLSSTQTAEYFYSAPLLVASGNGERILMNWDGAMSPSSMRYLDVSVGALQPTTSPPTLSFGWGWGRQGVTISQDGTRFATNCYAVGDAQFQLLGTLAVSDTEWLPSCVMTRDGTTIYALGELVADIGQSAPSRKPRIYVFDINAAGGGGAINAAGYFEFDDYPSCLQDLPVCDRVPPMAISPDAATLYFAGSDRFIVVPVPQALSVSLAATRLAAARAGAGTVTTAWSIRSGESTR
jgi:hypothetical protein